MSGVSALWIAVGSPLDALDDELLTFHMVQHLLLMAVAPPLILLGAPIMPLLHGLPQRFVRAALGPIFRQPAVQWGGGFVTHPVFCLLAASLAVIAWHYPPLFELGLRSSWWHEVEHACFLHDRASVLVAGRAAVAECRALAAMVHSLVPVSCHFALRCALCVSCFL